jgi:DNA topoisomerase VI subunit B
MDRRQKVIRTAFTTDRSLEFLSRKELIAQTGHEPESWPLVVLKELMDNALDACEEAVIQPEIKVAVDGETITVADNGPGIPRQVVKDMLDFTQRVSAREAYVAPDRGAQGNALKTIVAMPFALNREEQGRVEIAAQGIRHEIALWVDPIRQQPVINHVEHADENAVKGTVVRVHWGTEPAVNLEESGDDLGEEPGESSCSILQRAKFRFLQFADDFTFLNPHLALTVRWQDEQFQVPAGASGWNKWRPSDPAPACWYDVERFERLIGACVAHDANAGADRTVRELVADFRGLASTAKQKAVLEECGLARTKLSALTGQQGIDRAAAQRLLDAMKNHSKPVRAKSLGIIGKDFLAGKFAEIGCEMESFKYARRDGVIDDTPWVLEMAFAWSPRLQKRRMITGVNFSPAIENPFRKLGAHRSLDGVLAEQRAGRDEPVVLLIHLTYPRAEFSDRGKSALVIERS